MTIVAANWVGENTSTIGTGPLALSGAISTFCPFSVLPDGSEVYYTLQEGFNRETGIGVVSNGTLTRKVQATLVAGVYTETDIPISLSGNGQVFAVINADFMTRIYNFSLYVADSVAAAAASAQAAADSAALANDYETQSAQNAEDASASALSASDSKVAADASKTDAAASAQAAADSATAAAGSATAAAGSATAAAGSAAEAKQYLLSIEQPVIDISESVADAQNAAAAAEMARDQAQGISTSLVQTIDSQLSEQETQFENQMTTQQSSFESSQSERESAFEEKSNEFESRFSSQLSTQESTFSESQADKENRFQQFLLSPGCVFLGDYENGPFQFSARNQYIRYDNQYYRLNAATGVGFTTTGTDATSFASDVAHFVLMDGDTLCQNMAAGDGLKYIGQCANYAELRTKTPEYDGQKIYVRSSVAGWASLDDAFPSAPMTFVSLSRFKLADFPDDGGTLIAAADGVNVWVNTAILERSNILVEWFGAENNFTSDSTSVIERALAAAEFWATRPYGRTRGPLGHRWRVKFPSKWTASRTITYNPVLAELDFMGGTGLFLSDGTYGTHPKDSTVPVCFYLKCEKPANPGSDMYIPAYNNFPLAKNGSLVFGTLADGKPYSPDVYNVLPTTRHCLFAHNGVSETLYTALGVMEDLSISGFGLGYKNGDYAWGVRFVRVKFTNNGAMASFKKHLDNGERFDFVNCMSMNNARGFEFNDWGGQINWQGGSFDYFKEDAPFTWDSGAKAKLSIMQAHFEFNPYITGCMFDLSAAHENANLSIRDSFMVLAVGADDGGVINDAFIKRKYTHHAVVDNMTIVDVSASGQFTKNYLFFEDTELPALAYNMNPVTLKDYFVASPFLNRRRIAQWQFYFSGSTDFIPTFTDDSVSVAGSASAVAGQDKSLFVFIPAADVKTNVQFLLGMLTCTRCDVNVAFAMWTGYSKSAAPGLVNSSDIVIDKPVGAEKLVTLKVGRNSSVTPFAGGEANPGGFILADWARILFSKPAEGLIIRIWLYNQGPGDTVTLSANSGLITL